MTLELHSCKDTDKYKDDTCNSCPENGFFNSFQMLWNNGMHDEQQTADNIGYAVINPKVEYIGKNTSQNNNEK